MLLVEMELLPGFEFGIVKARGTDVCVVGTRKIKGQLPCIDWSMYSNLYLQHIHIKFIMLHTKQETHL
jgi:hypothetical protein